MFSKLRTIALSSRAYKTESSVGDGQQTVNSSEFHKFRPATAKLLRSGFSASNSIIFTHRCEKP